MAPEKQKNNEQTKQFNNNIENKEPTIDEVVEKGERKYNDIRNDIDKLLAMKDDNNLGNKEKVDNFIMSAKKLIPKTKVALTEVNEALKKFGDDSKINPGLTEKYKEIYVAAYEGTAFVDGEVNRFGSGLVLGSDADDFRKEVKDIKTKLANMPKEYTFLA